VCVNIFGNRQPVEEHPQQKKKKKKKEKTTSTMFRDHYRVDSLGSGWVGRWVEEPGGRASGCSSPMTTTHLVRGK